MYVWLYSCNFVQVWIVSIMTAINEYQEVSSQNGHHGSQLASVVWLSLPRGMKGERERERGKHEDEGESDGRRR